MGYCISQNASKFRIPIAKQLACKEAVKALDNKEHGYSWVRPGFGQNALLVGMFRAWRWEVSHDNEWNIIRIAFDGEKAGDDDTLFKAIAPYVDAGSFIEMQGEDGEIWRWVFNGKTCETVTAKVSFVSETATPSDQKRYMIVMDQTEYNALVMIVGDARTTGPFLARLARRLVELVDNADQAVGDE